MSPLTLVLCAILAAGVLPDAESAVHGTWRMDLAGRGARLTLHPDGVAPDPGLETWVPCASLPGLGPAAASRGPGSLEFEFAREAGRLIFRGESRRGGGRGSFSFHPDPRFTGVVERLGAPPDPQVLLALALGEVSLDAIRALVDRGYGNLTAEEILGMTARVPAAASPRLLLPAG